MSGPVPTEFISTDADGHLIDTRTDEHLEAQGAVSWRAVPTANAWPDLVIQGQGYYPSKRK